MGNKRPPVGPILIIIAALLWGVDGIIRRNLYALPPIAIIFFEHLAGFLVLTPFVFKNVFKVKLGKKEWALVFLVALLSGLLGTLWFTAALLKVNFISFSVVFLLQKLQPIFAIATAYIFLKEKLDRRYIIWAVIALVSGYFITFPGGYINFTTGSGTVVAALYALGAAFAWGTSTTFSKMLLGKVPASASAFYRFLFTLILALPLAIIFGYGKSLIVVTPYQVLMFLVIAVSTGMLALVIYYKGLALTPVRISAILELAFPAVAILIDMFLYHNFLTVSQWIFAAILAMSMYKIAKMQNKNIAGKVIRGVQKGRRLGFPTANIMADKNLDSGIYAGKVIIEGKEHGAVIYCPGNKLMEAFIFDFSGDLYGKEVEILIIKKLRERKTFKSEEEAKEQITKDVEKAKEYFY